MLCLVPNFTTHPKLWAEYIQCKDKAVREETVRKAREAKDEEAAEERRQQRPLELRRIRAIEEANRPQTCTSGRDYYGNWVSRCSR